MHLRNNPPIFVPFEHWAEVEALSKAALMDIVWDYAIKADAGLPIDEFRRERDIVLLHRKQSKASP